MNYTRALALAVRLIEKNGREVTFQTLSATPVDADKPWNGPAEPTVSASKKSKAVFLAHTGSIELGKMFVDNELLKRVDEVALVAGSVVISDYHRVLDESKLWRIDWIRELKPASTTVLYAVGLCL